MDKINENKMCLYERQACLLSAVPLPSIMISSIIGRMIGNYFGGGPFCDKGGDDILYTPLTRKRSLVNKQQRFVDC